MVRPRGRGTRSGASVTSTYTSTAREVPTRRRPRLPRAGRLIDRLWRKFATRSNPSDRRGSLRHEVKGRELWVGWSSRGSFGASRGQVRNLSRGGVEIVLDRRPPRKGAITLYREVDGETVSVTGQMVGYKPAPGGAYVVRLRFDAFCPTALCQAVLCAPPKGTRRGVDA